VQPFKATWGGNEKGAHSHANNLHIPAQHAHTQRLGSVYESTFVFSCHLVQRCPMVVFISAAAAVRMLPCSSTRRPSITHTHTHSLAALGHGRSTGRQMRKARLQVGLFVMALLLTLVTQDKDPPAQTGPGSKGARLIPSGPYRARPYASSWERERSAHTRANQPASANNRPHERITNCTHHTTHTATPRPTIRG
jgi:hypothetical protein